MAPTSHPVYMRRRWYCPNCAQTGIVLIHRLDGPERVSARRRVSHRAASPLCDPSDLAWVTSTDQHAPHRPLLTRADQS